MTKSGSVVWIKGQTFKWAAGFTVAPRKVSSAEQSITSCINAGFSPYVFCEPGSSRTLPGAVCTRPDTIAESLFRVAQIGHTGLYGCLQNYLQALADMLEAEPEAEMILYLQDDTLCPRGLKEFLNEIDWKDIDLLSLWCPSEFNYPQPEKGFVPPPEAVIIGAVGYAMTRNTAEYLTTTDKMLYWTGPVTGIRKKFAGSERRNSDMATGIALKAEGFKVRYSTVSLVDHFEPVLGNSSIGNGSVKGYRKSFRYVGNNCEAADIRRKFEI